jgi:hypothetical protein
MISSLEVVSSGGSPKPKPTFLLWEYGAMLYSTDCTVHAQGLLAPEHPRTRAMVMYKKLHEHKGAFSFTTTVCYGGMMVPYHMFTKVALYYIGYHTGDNECKLRTEGRKKSSGYQLCN